MAAAFVDREELMARAKTTGDLSGEDLTGIDFSGEDLSGVDF